MAKKLQSFLLFCRLQLCQLLPQASKVDFIPTLCYFCVSDFVNHDSSKRNVALS